MSNRYHIIKLFKALNVNVEETSVKKEETAEGDGELVMAEVDVGFSKTNFGHKD